jgi:hypothetical protein
MGNDNQIARPLNALAHFHLALGGQRVQTWELVHEPQRWALQALIQPERRDVSVRRQEDPALRSKAAHIPADRRVSVCVKLAPSARAAEQERLFASALCELGGDLEQVLLDPRGRHKVV